MSTPKSPYSNVPNEIWAYVYGLAWEKTPGREPTEAEVDHELELYWEREKERARMEAA